MSPENISKPTYYIDEANIHYSFMASIYTIKSNGWSNDNKEVMHIKMSVCNALAVANKYRDPLPIKVEMRIK